MVCLCLTVTTAFAASGDLDPTLLGGRVRTDFDGWFDQAQAVVVQPDGTIVAAGLVRRQIGSTGGGIPLFRAELGLVRYTAAGALDDDFGTDGIVRTDFGEDVDVRVLLRDPADGDLIAVGNTPSFPQKVVMARYTASGTPDPSVGGGTGHVVTTIPGLAYAGLVRADGRIVVGGGGRDGSGFDAFLLARLNANGTPDDTFDGDGFLISNQGAAIRGMLPAAGDAIVVGGWIQSGGASGFRNFVAARFTEAGAVDTTFGGTGSGRVVVDFFNASLGDEGRAIARMADGTLVVGGFAFQGSDRHFALAFLDANGALDLDFGGGTGKVTTPVTNEGIIRDLVVQSSGGVLAIGETGTGLEVTALASDHPELTLARYDGVTGALDPTFGDDGTITHRLRGTESPRAATLQSDDEPIVVGRASEDWYVLRLTPTGQADPTFGSGGRVLVQTTEAFQSYGGLLQPDGKIVLAGRGLCQANCVGFLQSQMALTRHLPDGRLDPTFGALGLAMPQLGLNQVAVAVARQADGSIVAGGTSRAGNFGVDDFAVLRLSDTGAPDAGFGTGGLATLDFFGGHDVVVSMVLQPGDVKPVLVGEVVSAGKTVFGVARFTTSGVPDPAFGTGGKVTTDLPGADDVAQGVVVQPDGKIVVVGYTGNETSSVLALVRYLHDGMPDASFGTNGIVLTPVTARADGASDVIRNADGTLVVSGWVDFGGDEDFAVLRYLENGTLDPDFATAGIARTDLFGFHGPDEAITLTTQLDGKLILLGDTRLYDSDDFAVARFSADGDLDTAFGAGGHMLVDLFHSDDFDPRSALIQPDGRLVGVGSTGGMGFFRMETAGGPQPTFPPTPTSTTTSTTLAGGSTTTTSTTLPGGTTTTTLPGGSTTTTSTVPGGSTTTTTLPAAAEICGNCVDDDGNGRVDYDDPACCAGTGTLQVRKAQLRPGTSGGKLSLSTSLAGAGFPTVDPTAADLFVHLAGGDGATILCARVPASAFKRKKKLFVFADKSGAVAAGISGVKVKLLKTQQLQVVATGKRARFGAVMAGPMRLTLAFDDADSAPGQCATATPSFRAIGKNKGVRFP
ncbi:MAG TPA: hypothetical protein VGR62_11205 [Candidatus Binatia bacterium]|nr:hypothetical protein [Candidatus Binatia bacterium]